MKTKLPRTPQVSFDELVFAYELGGRAATNQIPRSGVGGLGVNIDLGDGTAQRVELTDIPMNRAMIAIRDHFPKGKMQPLMFRIMAMSEMLQLPEGQRYMRPASGGEGEFEISEAVFRVAAEMPLNSNLSFNAPTFFKRVAKWYEANPD